MAVPQFVYALFYWWAFVSSFWLLCLLYASLCMCINDSLGRNTAVALVGVREFTLKILMDTVKRCSKWAVLVYISTTNGRAIHHILANTECYQSFYFSPVLFLKYLILYPSSLISMRLSIFHIVNSLKMSSTHLSIDLLVFWLIWGRFLYSVY